MTKKFWWKSAMILAAGSLFQFSLSGGCIQNIAQRFLIDSLI